MTTTATPKKWNEARLYDLIAKLHPAPQWACLPTVRNTTGYARTERTADALAMSLWPSRGLELHGFEIKCNRADWRRELRAPDKAEVIARFCHRWWLVAPADVVPLEEVPPAWGLYEAEGGKLTVAKPAERCEPEPVSHRFVAAVLRAAQKGLEVVLAGHVPEAAIEDRIEEAREEGRKAGQGTAKRVPELLRKLTAEVAAFEVAAGIKIRGDWQGPVHAGRLLKTAMALENAEVAKRTAAQAVKNLRGLADGLERQAAKVWKGIE